MAVIGNPRMPGPNAPSFTLGAFLLKRSEPVAAPSERLLPVTDSWMLDRDQ
jgi:hypothetical protein